MFRYFLALLITSLIVMPVAAQDAPAANLADSCVADYIADVDYFPQKATFEFAEGVEVEYADSYKIVRVPAAYPGAEEPLEYVLVQCGTPPPDASDFADNAQFIEIPADDIIVMSTTQLPNLVALDLLDNLIGLESATFVSTPDVVALAEAGELIEIGSGTDVNVELVLDAEPDIVLSYAYAPEGASSVLTDAGVFTAVNNEWLEETLIARAEWIKFLALFYNAEADANAIFEDIVADYEETAALTASIPEDERITVLWNAYTSFGEAWDIPGQQTWVGDLLADAGVDYVLMEAAPESSVPVDFEVVYDAGIDAPYWVPNTFGVNTLDDLLAQDSRYADFAAAQTGNVFDNTARINPNGGNDFWETGVNQPNVLLRDLVSIFYPELLPDHELVYYRPLEAAGE